MGWLASAGEFLGSFGTSFIERRARTKCRKLGSTKADGEITAYNAVTKDLIDCLPMEEQVTRRVLNDVCKSLKITYDFPAQLAIDANPGPRQREIFIALLKLSYLCSKNPSEIVGAATYTMIAFK